MALELFGVIEANVRLLMVPASPEERAEIRSTLAGQGLLRDAVAG